MLTYNEAEDASKVWVVPFNDLSLKTRLSTEYFYEADIPYKYDDVYHINALAVYKDRLYAACDGGMVIVFTECAKCYKLKKPVSFDIKYMTIEDGVMCLWNDTDAAEISMSKIGGDTIAAEEARLLISGGAVLVDVRTPEEFAQGSADGAVNIPLDRLEEGLKQYSPDTTIIFACGSGARAESAVVAAAGLGYRNTYSAGSIFSLK